MKEGLFVPTPILLVSDNPTLSTGLGRITHDIAIRIHRHIPEFRVGVVGTGGTSSRAVPYQLYPTQFAGFDYVIPDLPRIWADFSGGEKGIVLTIWNHTWLNWLANPKGLPDGEMRKFLETKPFKLWGYIPIDGERSDGSTSEGHILEGFDRLLAYTDFGAGVIRKTIGKEVESIGHGNDEKVFYPRSRSAGRKCLAQIPEDTFLIGCVATNTPRKDWGLAFETAKLIQDSGRKVMLWAHTDLFQRTYDIAEMAKFYQVKTLLTNFHMANEDMAVAISACDVSLGIGSGEGWGLPLSESLACGVPVVTGDYAGAPEFVPSSMRVKAAGYKVEGVHLLKRPVFDPRVWAARAMAVADSRDIRESLLPAELNWDKLWLYWAEWLVRGREI